MGKKLAFDWKLQTDLEKTCLNAQIEKISKVTCFDRGESISINCSKSRKVSGSSQVSYRLEETKGCPVSN